MRPDWRIHPPAGRPRHDDPRLASAADAFAGDAAALDRRIRALRHAPQALAQLLRRLPEESWTGAQLALMRQIGIPAGRQLARQIFGVEALLAPAAAVVPRRSPLWAAYEQLRAAALRETIASARRAGADTAALPELDADARSAADGNTDTGARPAVAASSPGGGSSPRPVGDERARRCSRALTIAGERHAAALMRRQLPHAGASDADRAEVERALQTRGTGQPLDPALRAELEPRLGIPLAHVRVHTDGLAAAAASAVGASAFTVGDDIFFAHDAFAPADADGRRLLVHELTHVAQYYQGRVAGGGMSERSDPLEVEAEAASDRFAAVPATPVVAAVPPRPSAPAPTRVHRFQPTQSKDPMTRLREMLDYFASHHDWGKYSGDDLVECWNGFGSSMPDVANGEFSLWQRSIAQCPPLPDNLDGVRTTTDDFKTDVQQTALGHLDANEQACNAELQKYGITLDSPIADSTGSIPDDVLNCLVTDEQKRQLAELQKLAQTAIQVKEMLDRISKTPVDFDRTPFTPDCKPKNTIAFGPGPNDDIWDMLKVNWDRGSALLALIGNSSPTLFDALNGSPADLKIIATTDPNRHPTAALAKIQERMRILMTAIKAARINLHGNVVDPLEMKPIHQQLFGKGKWSLPFNQWVAKYAVANYEFDQWWQQLGFEAAELAVLVVADLATMGGAMALIAVGVGMAAYQANAAQDKANAMSSFGASQAKSDTAIVYRGQISAAQAAAEAAEMNLMLTAAGGGLGALAKFAESAKVMETGRRLAALRESYAAELQANAALQKQVDALELLLQNPDKADEAAADLERIVQAVNACFVAGTRVSTPEGPRPIEALRVGDRVFCSDPERGEQRVGRVARTFVREVPLVLAIVAGGETICASPPHPFWVDGVGWRAAASLEPGMALLRRDGGRVLVESIAERPGTTTVYNVEVDALHTYFVSSLELLVHNKSAQLDPVERALELEREYKGVLKERPELQSRLQALQSEARQVSAGGDANAAIRVNRELEQLEADLAKNKLVPEVKMHPQNGKDLYVAYDPETGVELGSGWVDEDGQVHLDLDSRKMQPPDRPPGLRIEGWQVQEKLLDAMGGYNKPFRAKWSLGLRDNLDAFNANLLEGMSEADAARNTWSGGQCGRRGLTEVSDIAGTHNAPGTEVSVRKFDGKQLGQVVKVIDEKGVTYRQVELTFSGPGEPPPPPPE